MKWRSRLAVISAKITNKWIRRLNRGNGSTFPGYVARLVDPDILSVLSGMVKKKIFVVMGTNGKTTTTHILCHVLEAQGWKVVSNRSGANMMNGITAALALAADAEKGLDADYACIELDEFAADLLGQLKPHCVIVTNISRDQLDRFGEVDIVLDRLRAAFLKVPDAALALNCDDAVSWSLAMESGNPLVSYGISQCFDGKDIRGGVRESAFCRVCGSPLEYAVLHYGQLGVWRCPGCGAGRPEPDYSAEHIRFCQGSYTFRLRNALSGAYPVPAGDTDNGLSDAEKGSYIGSGVRFSYNIYNTLAAYAALDSEGASRGFGDAMKDFDYGNSRECIFKIKKGKVQLHLAKNPIGFQMKLSLLLRDPEPKDIVIQVNDEEEDGKDISWLWDVDFQYLKNVNAAEIIACGSRRYDLGLRLKYEDISWNFTEDIRGTVRKLAEEGTGNLYVIVNYSGLYRMNHMLERLQKGAGKHETDHRTFIPKSAQFIR